MLNGRRIDVLIRKLVVRIIHEVLLIGFFMKWYVLQCKPGQGDRALMHLQNQDIPCFYPKVMVETLRSGKRGFKLEALFSGYIFINLSQLNPVWSKLRSTRGVIRIVGFGGKPLPVEDEVIDHLRTSLNKVASAGGIKAGDDVDVLEGPFAGMRVIFQCYDGDERAIVLIEFMQRNQRISVPILALKSQ
jgi:transcriptional antiterminator RfaH